MHNLNVLDETSPLKTVVLGTSQSNGREPKAEEAYDPKSLAHILTGTYPKEADMITEMEGFATVLRKHGVQVLRPKVIDNCNQIFSRDIAFVIDNTLVKSNILPDREQELDAIAHVIEQIDPACVIQPPEEVHIEGGDVMPWGKYIFVGTYTAPDYPSYITARTNKAAIEFLKAQFPNKEIKPFELRKSNTNPSENALHLDCCFQPVGKDKAIIYKGGFLVEEEYQWLVDLFGKENVFEVSQDEMSAMFCNVFSISPEVIVSEKSFKRLNNWLRQNGFTVEEIPYAEISKQGGLLRCSTLPLERE